MFMHVIIVPLWINLKLFQNFFHRNPLCFHNHTPCFWNKSGHTPTYTRKIILSSLLNMAILMLGFLLIIITLNPPPHHHYLQKKIEKIRYFHYKKSTNNPNVSGMWNIPLDENMHFHYFSHRMRKTVRKERELWFQRLPVTHDSRGHRSTC